MRRNLPPTTPRHRSQSVSCATPSRLSPSVTKFQPTQLQHRLSHDMGAESTSPSPTHGRRESLVKPTWQNMRPGQIPLKTLDKINGITSDSDNEDCEYLRRSSISFSNNGGSGSSSSMTTDITEPATLGQQQQQQQKPTAMRKHSSSNLGQLTRKGSLVVHRDSLSSNASLKSARPSIDNTSVYSAFGQSADGKANKSSGRSLVRIISNKCTTVSSSDEEMDYDLLAKNKVVVIDGTRVKLQIWDTAGQERFRSVTHAYYRDAHALLLLYDVTNKTTYDNIRAWLCEIRDCAQEDVVIVLIGNKSDCSSSERQVKREDGERLAREHNVPFMETSAKTGLNVELAFQTVARQLKNRGYENGDDGKFNVHEFVRDNTKAKSICAQCSF